jgi:two-component system alkaline phosphatase synthesis response regulator PhoP
MAFLILVADDEPHISRALSFALQREGFTVDVASNGEETLHKVREGRPKIVFLDIVMPKKTGLEICREIKGDPELKDICVIILTAKGQELDRRDCIAAGADGYMTKPFSPREVVERVRSHFTRG